MADNQQAKNLLGWIDQVPFDQGLGRTIDWYLANREQQKNRQEVDQHLNER